MYQPINQNVMLKKIKHLVIVSLIISFTACSNDEKSTGKIDLTGMKIELSNDFLGNPLLFEYNDLAELENKTAGIVELLMEESSEIIGENLYTDIVMSFKFKDGKALISEYYLLNTRDKHIEGKVLNETNQTLSIPSSTFLLSMLNSYVNGSNCPQGYTMLKSCSNQDTGKGCIAGTIESYVSSNTDANGCANVQVKVGLVNTRVCGSTC